MPEREPLTCILKRAFVAVHMQTDWAKELFVYRLGQEEVAKMHNMSSMFRASKETSGDWTEPVGYQLPIH